MSFNRTREAGNRDEVEAVVANTLKLFRNGAVGFIDWLDADVNHAPIIEENEEAKPGGAKLAKARLKSGS